MKWTTLGKKEKEKEKKLKKKENSGTLDPSYLARSKNERKKKIPTAFKSGDQFNVSHVDRHNS